jgi:hypothetical protein
MQVTYNFTRRDLRAYYEFSSSHDRVALNQLQEARRTEKQSIAAMILFALVLGYEICTLNFLLCTFLPLAHRPRRSAPPLDPSACPSRFPRSIAPPIPRGARRGVAHSRLAPPLSAG